MLTLKIHVRSATEILPHLINLAPPEKDVEDVRMAVLHWFTRESK